MVVIALQQVEEFDNYMLCNDSCFERFDDQTQADFNETAFISFIFCSMWILVFTSGCDNQMFE